MYSVSKKGIKPLTQLKTIHNEHYSKLQSKHLSETELLDDLRLFCKQRAVIERDYGQALQKLVSGFLSKREFATYAVNDSDVPHGQNIWRVWRTLLDECNSLALSRLRSSETHQRFCRELKPLKLQRLTANKQVFEQLRTLQNDLAASVQEMSKSHKVYAEEEKQAQVTRLKAMAAEEKIRRRSTDIFHSMAQLHRNYEKLLIRRQAYNARSATARNEYLFQLAAINAHLKHYFAKDVPSLVKVLDGDLYEKLSDVLTSLSQIEVEICTVARGRFQQIYKDATQITRTCAWDSFLKMCPFFDETVQYQFEPIEGDETALLRSPDAKDASLEQIARKLARRLVLRERRIASYESELKTLEAGCATPYRNAQTLPGSPDFENADEVVSFNQEYVEHKAEEIRFAIRREDIELVKIEACLSLLHSSSVDVKPYITAAREAAEAAAAAALAERLREVNRDSVHDIQSVGCPKTSGEGSIDSMSLTAGQFSDSHVGYSGSHQGAIGFQSGQPAQSRYYGNTYSARGTLPSLTFDRSLASRLSSVGFGAELDSKLNNQNVNPKGNTWDLVRTSQSITHDYQNVNQTCYAKDDSTAARPHSGTEKLIPCDLDDKTSGGPIDLEIIWSENGRLRQANVLREFRAKRPGELDLVLHETVVLLESEDKDGWIKVRSLIDGNEGLVPINFLRLHDVINGSGLDIPNNSEVSGSNIDLDPNVSDKNKPNDSKTSMDYQHNPTKRSTLGAADQISGRRHHRSPGISNVKSTRRSRTNSLPPTNQEAPKSHSAKCPAINDTSNATENDNASQSSLRPGTFVRALVEFEGTNEDELKFCSGAIIRVMGKAPAPQDTINDAAVSVSAHSSRLSSSFCSGMDDGWLEGELLICSGYPTPMYSWTKGVFPSMVVQPLSLQESEPWLAVWQLSALNGAAQQATIAGGDKSSETYPRPTVIGTSNTLHIIHTSDTADRTAPTDDYIQWSTENPHKEALQSLADIMLDSSLRDPSEEDIPIAEL